MPLEQDDQKSLILQVVIELLSRRGPDGVTMRDVSKKSKVSLGKVRYSYRTKSKLFAAALDWLLEQMAEFEAELKKEDPSPRERLTFFFMVQERLLLERSDLLAAWFNFIILGRDEPWVAAQVQENYVSRVETVRTFLKEMMDKSLIRPDLRPSLTAEDMVASVEGMGLLWLNRIDSRGIAAHRRRAVNRWLKNLGLTAN